MVMIPEYMIEEKRQVIELPASDKNWRMKLSPNGERFIFSHPDFPTRIVGRDKSCSIVTVQPERA